VAITEETLKASQQQADDVGAQSDSVTRDRTAAWALLVAGLLPALGSLVAAGNATAAVFGRWPQPWEWSRLPELGAAQEAATEAVTVFVADATQAMRDAAAQAVAISVATEPTIMATQAPDGAGEQIAAAVAAAIATALVGDVAGTVTAAAAASMALLPASATAWFTAALYRGPQGQTPMVDTLVNTMSGVLTSVIATTRVAVHDAYRAAVQAVQQSAPEMVAGWIWVANLDTRICPACLAMHGTVSDLSVPGPIDHQHGRCRRLTILIPWVLLGFDEQEPDLVVPDARQWFDQLDEADQARILGPGRLRLFKQGLITWDDIPVRRSSPRWRDTYTPRSLADLQRIAAQRHPNH
jgi:hypothetical protein